IYPVDDSPADVNVSFRMNLVAAKPGPAGGLKSAHFARRGSPQRRSPDRTDSRHSGMLPGTGKNARGRVKTLHSNGGGQFDCSGGRRVRNIRTAAALAVTGYCGMIGGRRVFTRPGPIADLPHGLRVAK